MNMTYKRSRAIAALAIVVIVAVCVAACGSSSSTSSSSSSSSGSSSAAASAGGATNRAKLAACLKQHGVTLPSRPRSGGGYGSPPGSGNGNGNGNGGTGNGNGNGLGNSGSNNGNHNGAGPAAGGRFNNPKFQAAFKACGATAGFRGGSRGNFRPSSAAITKFASCVKQHGYTLPKANLTGKGAVYPVSVERNKKFQTASRSCQALLRPAGAGRAPGGGGPPGA